MSEYSFINAIFFILPSSFIIENPFFSDDLSSSITSFLKKLYKKNHYNNLDFELEEDLKLTVYIFKNGLFT